jgi:excinuclease ABC subunit B
MNCNAVKGVVVEQVVRPTGLLDPAHRGAAPARTRSTTCCTRSASAAKKEERVLVTTLTKRMAEELNDFLGRNGVKCKYIHSDVETLERIEILRQLRLGMFDVLVGVNLLREGLDLPEVSLGGRAGCRQGRLPAQQPFPHPDRRPGRAQHQRPGDLLRGQDHRQHAPHHGRDRPPPREADGLQRGEHGITPTQIKRDRAST